MGSASQAHDESASRLEQVVRTIAETCVENEAYFCNLDAVVGDGDFGYSLARGFEEVLKEWEQYDRSDLGTFLQQILMTMSRRIGGTSGPIWSTAFLRASIVTRGSSTLCGSDVVSMLRAAIAGIQARGSAQVGDKTLLDALVPLADDVERQVATGLSPRSIAECAAQTATRAADATKALEARRGRASYTGERSIGSPDPGAVAIAVLAEKIASTW
jgi:phosphoenolpyruvate---glycerone phosphotransferase subunit DhaL